MRSLLSADALVGRSIAISVSESADLRQLGLLEDHLRITLAEIVRCVLVSGGRILYSGHLGAHGYTDFIISEVERYRRTDRAFVAYLPWNVHRQTRLLDIEAMIERLGLGATVNCIGLTGEIVDPFSGRGDAPEKVDPSLVAASLTACRLHVTQESDGRVVVGGKRRDFLGRTSGIVEESILTIEADKALYLAGGFGGAAWDLLAVSPVDVSQFPFASHSDADEAHLLGLNEFAKLFDSASAADRFRNGLDSEECAKLGISHRPSEIASFASLGLARRFST